MKVLNFAIALMLIAFSNYSCAQQAQEKTEKAANTEQTTPQQTQPEAPAGQVVDIDVVQFKQMMSQPDVVVLDVRTPQEVAQGKITDDALNIDVTNKPLFEQEIEKLDKDKTYLVYCRSGHRSGIASQEMVRRGFKKVYNLKGGILAWQQANQ